LCKRLIISEIFEIGLFHVEVLVLSDLERHPDKFWLVGIGGEDQSKFVDTIFGVGWASLGSLECDVLLAKYFLQSPVILLSVGRAVEYGLTRSTAIRHSRVAYNALLWCHYDCSTLGLEDVGEENIIRGWNTRSVRC